MTEIYRKRHVNLIEPSLKLEEEHENKNNNEQVPLELCGVINSVKKYALQCSAIGMSVGIDELSKIEEIIRNLQPHDNGLQNILTHVEQRQKVLRETFREAYKM